MLRRSFPGNVSQIGRAGCRVPAYSFCLHCPYWKCSLARFIKRYVCFIPLTRAEDSHRTSFRSHHVRPILPARAIESQCYVIAAAQFGRHNAKRQSYGHSLVVDPWGKVLVDAGGFDSDASVTLQPPTIVICETDRAQISAVRERMPIQMHRAKADSCFRGRPSTSSP